MSTSRNKTVLVTLCLFVCVIAWSCFMTGCSSGAGGSATASSGASQAETPVAQESESAPSSVAEKSDGSIGEPTQAGIGVSETEQNTQPDETVGTAEETVTPDSEQPEESTREEQNEPDEPEEPEVPDTTPPVFKEYRSHLVYIGDTVSYRSGVILTDDSGEEPVLTIDSSQVNLKEAGEYPLTYTATDAAGNSATCEVTVVVREREEVTQEMLDARADEIIEKVLGDAPRDMEALETLFKWTKKNIHYVNYFEQNDDISAAWEGLVYERGDCYVYACASKELLTRAGFKNDMIRTARHYWNLVDLGEGWYHFDTTPHLELPNLCLITTDELLAYSNSRYRPTHDFDPSKYPEIP